MAGVFMTDRLTRSRRTRRRRWRSMTLRPGDAEVKVEGEKEIRLALWTQLAAGISVVFVGWWLGVSMW